jgi:hypothetical protein
MNYFQNESNEIKGLNQRFNVTSEDVIELLVQKGVFPYNI